MPRTISTSPPDPESTDDLDGLIVDGIESLRQRIVQALRFRLGEWFLNRQRGVDRNLLIGHQTTVAIATATLNEVIREEGGSEVLELRNAAASFDSENRIMNYSVDVDTIYGPMSIGESVA